MRLELILWAMLIAVIGIGFPLLIRILNKDKKHKSPSNSPFENN
jgi:hypothetical protein